MSPILFLFDFLLNFHLTKAGPLLGSLKITESQSSEYNPILKFDYSLEQPRVEIGQGVYLGSTLKSRAGRNYNAFVGIRYGSLTERFQQIASHPSPASGSIFNATTYGPFCLQHDWLKNVVLGSEDCLFLNIYVPHRTQDGDVELDKLPVMMYIHGGAFLFGSGNVYLPDYIMDEKVVFVTMNYRLGVLGKLCKGRGNLKQNETFPGFLSTQDSEISGNMGLKDQIVALRWIQKHIQGFSGDPSRVTIFGESAGGASVSFHLLSPLAKGLFVGGISHSGTALCPWAWVRDAKSVAIKLGKLMNCPVNNTKQLVACLKEIDPRELVTSQEKLTVWNRDPFAMFAPSAEFEDDDDANYRKSKSPIYMSESPTQAMCSGRMSKVPWIVGVCKEEGLTFHSAAILHNPRLTEELNLNWSTIAPITLLYQESSRDLSYVSKKVRRFYFGGDIQSQKLHPIVTRWENKSDGQPRGKWTKSLRNLTNLYSDRFFNHCTKKSVMLTESPTYLYRFSYEGNSSITNSFGIPFYGVAHGDDLQYFFPFSRFPFIPKDAEGYEFSRKVVKLWATFAETGVPVYEDGNWSQIQNGNCEESCALEWLDLNKNFTNVFDLYEERMRFWDFLQLHENEAE